MVEEVEDSCVQKFFVNWEPDESIFQTSERRDEDFSGKGKTIRRGLRKNSGWVERWL
jgi:hypothetical protein